MRNPKRGFHTRNKNYTNDDRLREIIERLNTEHSQMRLSHKKICKCDSNVKYDRCGPRGPRGMEVQSDDTLTTYSKLGGLGNIGDRDL